MKALLSTLLCAATLLSCHAAEDPETGFTPLFDGKSLDGWRSVGGNGTYLVENGEILGRGKNVNANTFLRTEKTFKDFDFRFQMKFDDLTGNSGMMFRGLQKDGDGRVYGYQCEHDNGKQRSWTAGLYDEARRGWLFPKAGDAEAGAAFTKKIQALMKWDDWNDIRILAVGNKIDIFLNGQQVVDFTDSGEHATPEGFFALQVHSGGSCNVRWKNIRIKELQDQ